MARIIVTTEQDAAVLLDEHVGSEHLSGGHAAGQLGGSSGPSPMPRTQSVLWATGSETGTGQLAELLRSLLRRSSSQRSPSGVSASTTAR